MALTGSKKQQLERLENLVKARKVLSFDEKKLLKDLRAENASTQAGTPVAAASAPRPQAPRKPTQPVTPRADLTRGSTPQPQMSEALRLQLGQQVTQQREAAATRELQSPRRTRKRPSATAPVSPTPSVSSALKAPKTQEEILFGQQLNELSIAQQDALDVEDFAHYEALSVEQKVLEAREKARVASLKGETFDLDGELKNIQSSWDNNIMRTTPSYNLEGVNFADTSDAGLAKALTKLQAGIDDGSIQPNPSGADSFEFNDLLTDAERSRFELDIESAYKEQSPKASTKPVVQLKSAPVRSQAPAPTRKAGEPRFVREVKEYLEPWSQRADEDVYWAGMTEQEWKGNVEDMHRELQGTIGVRAENEVIDRYFPNMPNTERNDMLQGNRKTRRTNSQISMGVPHAYSQEQQFVRGMQLSGLPAEFNNELNNFATDLRLNDQLIDVQGLSSAPRYLNGPMGPSLGIDIMKDVDEDIFREAFRESDSTWTLKNLQDRIYEIQRERGIPEGKPGKLLDFKGNDKVKPGFSKDILMGNVLDRDKLTNLIGSPQKGTFDPILGRGEYAIDLNNLRENIDRRGISNVGEFSPFGGNLRYYAPLKTIQKQAKSEGLIERYLDKDVLKSIDDIAINQGLREAGGTRFHAALPVPDLDMIRSNLKGEAIGAVVGALTDKEIMNDFGRGDYKKGAKRMAGDALTGAAVGGATQAATKAIAPLAAKIAGPAVSGMAGAAVAPAAVAYGLAQIPDAMISFRGGQQGRTFEEQKAVERAENVNTYREAMGGTAEGYRAPAPVATPAPYRSRADAVADAQRKARGRAKDRRRGTAFN